MALDLGGIRVVHAWWDECSRGDRSRPARRVPIALSTTSMFVRLLPRCDFKEARKLLTCGVEMELPPGSWIIDKEGHKHPDARLAVWRHWAERLRDIAIVPSGSEDAVPDIDIPAEHRLGEVEGAPILFGHHWFSGPLKLETPKVACLDWSAAKDGPLVAYRWDGESRAAARAAWWRLGPRRPVWKGWLDHGRQDEARGGQLDRRAGPVAPRR